MPTLDPADWEAFRRLAHQMIDDTVDHLRTLQGQPAWQEIPAEVRARLDEPLPTQPQGEEKAYRDYLELVRPYPNGNLHPRFFGWVQGPGVPLANMADMLASAINPHMGGFNQAPALVEHQVVGWMSELLDFPPTSSGLILSGGSMANLTALAVARTARPEGTAVYCSKETHNWVRKAAKLMGLGGSAIHVVPVDSEFRIDVAKLSQAVEEDRAKGIKPMAVIATAGTVNTGATDDLNAIAGLCQAHSIWMHVDGAFGALAYLSPKYRHLVSGMQRANSVAFDLHKWMYLPFEIACVLIKDSDAHRRTFAEKASYIAESTRGAIAGGLYFAEHGYELTRSFKALKAWMCLKAYGSDRFAEAIEENIEQAQYLAGVVDSHPNLELLAPVPMNIVCFRYNPGAPLGMSVNDLNEEILLRLQERGIAVPSSTMIDGQYAIRACIVNHRTTREDIDTLVQGVLGLGEEILAER